METFGNDSYENLKGMVLFKPIHMVDNLEVADQSSFSIISG